MNWAGEGMKHTGDVADKVVGEGLGQVGSGFALPINLGMGIRSTNQALGAGKQLESW